MNRTTVVLAFLAALTAAPGVRAASDDDALCRGEYAFMLMTPDECRQYVRQMGVLRARGDARALQQLQRQHAELLRERAAACPCVDGQPVEGPRQQLALADSPC